MANTVAPTPTTILMNAEDLKNIIEFKLASLDRAIKAEYDNELRALRIKLRNELAQTLTTINQYDLPIPNTPALQQAVDTLKKTK